MKPLPIGIQTFKDIIESDFIYIDKTKFLYNLIKLQHGAYFLSRPRRFGKSLLISTLKEIFEGNKELFKNLWIYKSDYNWQKYPVLRFDFSSMRADTPDELKYKITLSLKEQAEHYNIALDTNLFDSQFKELLIKLAKQLETQKVVVLVDEYDAPIIQHITDVKKAKQMRDVLKNFYTIIKGMDEVIRFVFLTGVSKFSKAGVFSGLNNLKDLTINTDFSSMLGLTEQEISINLTDYIEKFAAHENTTSNDILKQLRIWYNGYCFSNECTRVYNPFSTFNALADKRFSNYWFETGTPTFLLKLIREKQFDISEIPTEVKELSFSTYEIETLEILPLLFQTGYLTIKGYNRENRYYRLDYPNLEVKESFLDYLLRYNTRLNGKQDVYLEKMFQTLRNGDIPHFFKILKYLFIDIPYDIRIEKESYYQSIFYLIFIMLGFRIQVEVKTDIGRIDAVVETDKIYIFEFKLRGTKEDAIKQIKEKCYYEKYENKNKPIYLIGIRFDSHAKEEYFDWVIEEIKKG